MGLGDLFKKNEGPEGTRMLGDTLLIDCGDCSGSGRLEEKGCFSCIMERVVPGFKGEIVIKGPLDRSYRGPIVEALVSCYEISQKLRSVEEKAKALPRGQRTNALKTVGKIRETFKDDPSLLQESVERSRKTLGPIKEIHTRVQDIGDDAALMIRKLEKRIERPPGDTF